MIEERENIIKSLKQHKQNKERNMDDYRETKQTY